MTDASIVIGIEGEISGGRVIKRTLDDIAASGDRAKAGQKQLESQFKATGGAADFLKRSLTSLGVAFGLRELQQTVDAYTNIQNRLKLVTGGVEELTAVTEELFKISNETRQSFTATAEVYSRVALATKELGLSQRETLDFSKSLNQAVVLSGASAAEASAGLIQLSQGLASGALRGDELRSVLEQLPAVADVIAKSLGITRGELRQMGQDGKITADIIIEAFKKASGELDANFAKTVPTIGQSFEVLKNKFMESLGEFDKLTGSSALLATALIKLGDVVMVVGYDISTTFQLLNGLFTDIVGSVLSVTTAMVNGIENVINAGIKAVNIFKKQDIAPVDFNGGLTSADIVAAQTETSGGMYKRAGATLEAANRKANDVFGFENSPLATAAGSGISTAKGVRTAKPVVDLEQAKKAQTDLNKLIKDTSSEQEKLIDKIKELERLKGFAKTDQEVEAINRALQQTNEQLATASDLIPGIDDAFADVGKTAADAFGEFVSGAKSGKDALRSLVNELYQMTIRQTITDPLSNILGSVLKGGLGGSGGGGGLGGLVQAGAGKLFGSIGSGLKSFFGFDSGGSMVLGGAGGLDQNILSLNGAPIARTSRGETLSISPNQRGGGGTVINQYLQVSTGVQQTVAAEMQAYLPKLKDATMAAIQDKEQRGIK